MRQPLLRRGCRSAAVALVSVVLAGGCGKKETPAAAGSDAPVTIPTGFVEISLDDEEGELEELFASELLAATAQCGDLVVLEPAAMLGKLDDAQVRCLDASLRAAERQTVKDKVSRVLLADAWAKGDTHRWEGVARRHLEEIDRSDPDMCYQYARHLGDLDAARADEAMKWAEVALENRSTWTGDLHVKRVYSLYKLKATSAQKKWQHLEAGYAANPGEEQEKIIEEARNLTKTLAREWLEYARQSAKDPTMALQLCISAAGTEDFCDDSD